MTNSLSTTRLQLAVPTPEDALAVLAIAGDPRAVEHNPSDLLADLTEAQDLVGRGSGIGVTGALDTGAFAR